MERILSVTRLLFSPVWTYWSIKGETTSDLKRVALILTIVPVLFIFIEAYYFQTPINLFHANGMISRLGNGFFALTGFFMTALAASTSLKGSENKAFSLDRALEGYVLPSKFLNDDGLWEKYDTGITYRQFFCLLFAYLAVSSAFFCFLGFLFPLLIGKVLHLFNLFPKLNDIIFFSRVFLSGILSFCIIHLSMTALLGVKLLSQNVHGIDRDQNQ